MGTSTRLAPRAGHWRGATRALREWQDHGTPSDRLGAVAAQLLDALRRDLATDPGAFGLRQAATIAGHRLVDLTAPGGRGIDLTATDSYERTRQLFSGFIAGVAGDGFGIGDAIVRRAAARTGERLVEHPEIQAQLVSPQGTVRLSGELFCIAYRLFLGDLVSAAVTAVVREKIRLLLPVLYMSDPLVDVSGWISEKVAGLIPDPCAGVHERGPEATLLDLGHELLAPAVDAAFG